METVIVDTSIFTNSASSSQFWDRKPRSAREGPPDPLEALLNFLKLAQRTPTVRYLITPGVYNELFIYKGGKNQSTFIDLSKVPKSLLITLEHASPKMHELKMPASLFVELISEFRTREHECEIMVVERSGELIDALSPHSSARDGNKSRKMNAEQRSRQKRVVQISETIVGASNHIEQMKASGTLIRNMRESHRDHMRVGMIDSGADMETILLAYQTEGYLVASDDGINKWGQKFGCRTIEFDQLRQWMEARVTK